MPELSRFYGIVVRLFYRDHGPAHIHVEYCGAEVLLCIDTLQVLRGSIPPRALGLVVEWAVRHREEIQECWKSAQIGSPPKRISPLD
jgi:hypothetical protein